MNLYRHLLHHHLYHGRYDEMPFSTASAGLEPLPTGGRWLRDEDTVLTLRANVSFTQVYLGSDLWVRVSLQHLCASYASYASIHTEKVTISSGTIGWPNLQLMQLAPSGVQF